VISSGGNGVTCSVSRVGERRNTQGSTRIAAFTALGLAATATLLARRRRRERLARRDATR
jgi:hypothetical protein